MPASSSGLPIPEPARFEPAGSAAEGWIAGARLENCPANAPRSSAVISSDISCDALFTVAVRIARKHVAGETRRRSLREPIAASLRLQGCGLEVL